jgi:queuine/archaeosine tRNA-ribosyltransferase
MLLSIHNVFFYLAWMKEMREAIAQGRLAALETPPEEKIPDGA